MYKIIEIGKKYTFSSSFILGFLLNFSLPPFGVWVLLLICLSSFLWILEKAQTPKKAFWTGFFFYFGYFFGGLYWIGISLSVDWTKFLWVLPFSCLGIPAALSLMMAPSFYGFWALKSSPFSKLMFLISLTLLLEIIRTYIFPQFPWNLLGYTLASSIWFLQSASFIGIFGLTVIALLYGAFPYLIFQKSSRKIGIVIGGVLLCTGCMGGIKLSHPPLFDENISLRLIQPNIPQTLKWNQQYRLAILNKLMDLSQSSQKETPPHLTVWPESAIPFFVEEDLSLRKHIATLLPPQGFLITGGGRRLLSQASNFPFSIDVKQVWNSLFVLNNTGEILDIYDKTHLVPFGEYIPFRSLLGILPVSKITHGTLDFSEGSSLKTISAPSIPPFSPLICYEIAFPREVINPNLPRPSWILNITNDAWFGTSTGPYQHLQMAQVRAVEEGLPVIRIANTGVSAVIDPYGRILKSLPLNETGIIDTYLPKPLNPTFYETYGNWTIILGLVLIWIFIGGQYIFYLKRKPQIPPPSFKTMLYGRRKGRPLRKNKTTLMENLLPHLTFTLTEKGSLPSNLFEDSRFPLWIEIGYGTGDHLISQLRNNPSINFIGCEPFLGGIAGFLQHLNDVPSHHTRIKLFTEDAQSLLKGIKFHSIDKIFVLFPDPWPKKRHHKRRFIQMDTVKEMSRVLKSGGTLTLASDHEDYFLEMEKLVNACDNLRILEHGVLPNTSEPELRPLFWPMTRFEKKAHKAGRLCKYLNIQKI